MTGKIARSPDAAVEHRRLFGAAAKNGITADILRDRAVVRGWGDSIKALTPAQKRLLRWEIEEKERGTDDSSAARYLRFRRGIPAAKYKMMAKVSRILAEAGRGWEYADGVAMQMFGCGRVEWLTDSHLHKLTAALAKDQTRRRRRSIASKHE